MPPAFLRRCLALTLSDEDRDFHTHVATSHFGPREDSLYADIAERTIELGRLADQERRRRPSMAEYLDTVRACIAFDQWPPSDSRAGSELWTSIEEAALRKTRRTPLPEDGEPGAAG